MAFNVAEFRANMVGDGARPNLFQVSLTFPTIASNGSAASQKTTFMAKAAQLPGSTIGQVPVYYFGREMKFAGNRTFTDWTLQIINDEDFVIRNSLESIMLDSGQEIAVDGQHLPKFMRTVNGDQPYGYFKAAVLCYTLPGQSHKILNRIAASKFNFDNLDFFVDRLVVQNSLDNTGTAYIAFNTQPIG